MVLVVVVAIVGSNNPHTDVIIKWEAVKEMRLDRKSLKKVERECKILQYVVVCVCVFFFVCVCVHVCECVSFYVCACEVCFSWRRVNALQ